MLVESNEWEREEKNETTEIPDSIIIKIKVLFWCIFVIYQSKMIAYDEWLLYDIRFPRDVV